MTNHVILRAWWLSAKHLFLSAGLRCRICCLVDTTMPLYVLCCSVQGRLQAVVLCLRYVHTAVAIGAWFVPSLTSRCPQKKQVQNKNKTGKNEKEKKTRDHSGKNNLPVGI